MSKKHLEEACAIWFGETVSIDDVHLTDKMDNPENQFMVKELLEKLSDEAKEMVGIIFRMPDEMFDRSGKMIAQQFRIRMKQFKWTDRKIEKAQKELRLALGGVL